MVVTKITQIVNITADTKVVIDTVLSVDISLDPFQRRTRTNEQT